MELYHCKGYQFVVPNIRHMYMGVSANVTTDLASKNASILRAGPIVSDCSDFDWPALSAKDIMTPAIIYLEINEVKISFGIASKSAYNECALAHDEILEQLRNYEQ
jgi:hypothetical protein